MSLTCAPIKHVLTRALLDRTLTISLQMAKFEVYRDRAGEYRWRLKAVNGEIVAVSESYTTCLDAHRSAQSVKRLALFAIVTDLVVSAAS